MAQGEITPGEAVQLANVLEVRRKAIETQELENRIAEVERTIEASRQPQSGYEEGLLARIRVTGSESPG